MTVDIEHAEIFDQAHQMWAEGTSIGSGEGVKPKEADIQKLLGGEGWITDEIDIWFDNLQNFWRWSCKIEKALHIADVISRTFEYRVIDHDMFDEDEIRTMNSMGSKGWEIIRILEPMKWLNSDGMFVRIYYKREKHS